MITINDTTGLNLSSVFNVYDPSGSANNIVNVVVDNSLSPYAYVVTLLAFYALMIVFHELGHWFVLRRHYPNTQIKFGVWPGESKPRLWTGNDGQYGLLSNKEKLRLYIMGVLVGVIPILLAVSVHIAYLALLVPYGLGIRQDLKFIHDIEKIIRQEKKNGKSNQ